MSRNIQMKGLAELDRYLSALPMNMQKNAVRQALTAAARPIRDDARMRAPKKTGKLARSIKTGSARQNQDGTFSIAVRVTGRDAYIARFIEYGVRPHFIRAGDSGLSARKLTQSAAAGNVTGDTATKALKIGNNFVSGEVFHPGHGARPFMRPALDARADDAVRAFAGKIRDYIEGKTGFDAAAFQSDVFAEAA